MNNFFPDAQSNNPAVGLNAAVRNALALEFASPQRQNDENFVREVVNRKSVTNWRALEFVSPQLQNDENFVSWIVGINPNFRSWCALEFASPELKDNIDFALMCLEFHWEAIQFFSARLQNDPRVLRAMLSSYTKQDCAILKILECYFALIATNWVSITTVQAFLRANKDIINCYDAKQDKTPLLNALRRNQFELTEFLLIEGASFSLGGRNGGNALCDVVAKEKAGLPMVELLLAANGWTAEDFTSKEAIHPSGSTVLMMAAMNGRLDIVNAIIEKYRSCLDPATMGAKTPEAYIQDFINMKDNFGWTAVMKAADKGRTAVVEFLLDNGADLLCKDNSGYSALILAAKAGKSETVTRLLKDTDVCINEKNKDARTSLFYAAQNGHVEIVKKLLDKRADVTIQDKLKQTALQVTKDQEIKDLIKSHVEALSSMDGGYSNATNPHRLLSPTNNKNESQSTISQPNVKCPRMS